MHVLYDNLIAILIGATVLLILLETQMDLTENNLEVTTTYMLKKKAQDFATWMEEDLELIGKNTQRGQGDVPFTNPVDSAGHTVSFTFFWHEIAADTLNHNAADTTRWYARYDLARVGTRVIDDSTTVPVFEMRRYERRDMGPWTQTGQSPLLSAFQIEMLNRDAEPVDYPADEMAVNPDTIQNTRLRFALATPFETKRQTLRKTYYGSTLLVSF